MNKLNLQTFNDMLARTAVKTRLKNELRFVTSVENISDQEWEERELLAITGRNGNKGILLLSFNDQLSVIPYELKTGITSSATGRSQSVICDFCQTWQYGDKAASISFQRDRVTTVSYLCCADLKCSMHVRNKTDASHTSRTQLREDLTIEQRVERLKARLATYLSEFAV